MLYDQSCPTLEPQVAVDEVGEQGGAGQFVDPPVPHGLGLSRQQPATSNSHGQSPAHPGT